MRVNSQKRGRERETVNAIWQCSQHSHILDIHDLIISARAKSISENFHHKKTNHKQSAIKKIDEAAIKHFVFSENGKISILLKAKKNGKPKTNLCF